MLFSSTALLLASVPGLLAAPADQPDKQPDAIDIIHLDHFTVEDWRANWKNYLGNWTIIDNTLVATDTQTTGNDANGKPNNDGGKALSITNYKDLGSYRIISKISVNPIPKVPVDNYNAGIIFAVSDPKNGKDAYNGGFCGFNPTSSSLVIGTAANDGGLGQWTFLGEQKVNWLPGVAHTLKVEITRKADGDSSVVCRAVDTDETLEIKSLRGKLTLSDGRVGLRTFGAQLTAENFYFAKYT